MAEISWQYLAGFIDGEGCLGIARRKRRKEYNAHAWYFQPFLMIANTNLEVLQTIQAFLGFGKVARVTVPKGCKPAYKLTFVGKIKLLQVLKGIRPYLVVKAQNADELLDYLEFDLPRTFLTLPVIEYKRRETIFEKVRKLNLHGVACG